MRKLKNEEIELLRFMTSGSKQWSPLVAAADFLTVKEYTDGGMGSIAIQATAPNPGGRRFGRAIAACEFQDADGLPISVEINVDQSGCLFEIDIFKADFSAVSAYPSEATALRRPTVYD